jgi:hypothetical protein
LKRRRKEGKERDRGCCRGLKCSRWKRQEGRVEEEGRKGRGMKNEKFKGLK